MLALTDFEMTPSEMEKAQTQFLWLYLLTAYIATALMLTYWSTTIRDGKNEKRSRVDGDLVKFQYGEVMNWYCYRHAVDDNNNNQQGCLSFEEKYFR